MGSIIVYDALRDLGRSESDFELSHFVTIGSLLGLPQVKKKHNHYKSYDYLRAPEMSAHVVKFLTS
jgi:hypothetical protein